MSDKLQFVVITESASIKRQRQTEVCRTYGAGDGDRTHDLILTKDALYH
jgi:hypothetical protein